MIVWKATIYHYTGQCYYILANTSSAAIFKVRRFMRKWNKEEKNERRMTEIVSLESIAEVDIK
jgi:hypothetical protein